jgi:hypothetical protein
MMMMTTTTMVVVGGWLVVVVEKVGHEFESQQGKHTFLSLFFNCT